MSCSRQRPRAGEPDPAVNASEARTVVMTAADSREVFVRLQYKGVLRGSQYTITNNKYIRVLVVSSFSSNKIWLNLENKKGEIVKFIADHGMPGPFFLLPYPVSTTLHLGGHFPLSWWKRKEGKKETGKKKRHINSSRGNHTYSLLGLDDRVWEFRKTSETSLRSSASTQERKKRRMRGRGRKREHKVKTIEQTKPVVHQV